MKAITRRQFLKTTGKTLGVLAGGLVIPTYAFGNDARNEFYKDSEKILLARMIFGEARSSLDGKIDPDYKEPIMIGWTAINRANDKLKFNGENLKEAILKKKWVKNKKGKKTPIHQYSCFNPKDPNLKVLKNPKKYEPKEWEKSLHLAEKILEGKLSYLNYGQDHYYRKDTNAPNWTENPRMKKIWTPPFFDHEFYRDTKA